MNVMRHSGIAAVLALAIGCSALAQGRPLRTGQTAPPLELRAVLQGPPLDALGRAPHGDRLLVLEFWATWCQPCVAELDHLNRLADRFAGRVDFLLVSTEAADRVRAFLAQHPVRGWVAVEDGQTARAYGVYVLPTAFLIRSGRVELEVHPAELTPGLLEGLLQHRLPWPDHPGPALIAGQDPMLALHPPAMLFAEVRPEAASAAEQAALALDLRRDRITALALPAWFLFGVAFAGLRDAAADVPWLSGQSLSAVGTDGLLAAYVLHGWPSARLVGREALPEGRFTVVLDQPGGKAALLSGTLRRLLEQAWAVRAERSTAVLQALILRRKHGARAQPPAVTTRQAVYRTAGAVELDAATAADLARWIELTLERPVVDETGLSGRYDFVLPQPLTVPTLETALRGYGLELDAGQRPVPVVRIVRARSAPF
jgi:thiol-disulfide isomerase/thioredoxin